MFTNAEIAVELDQTALRLYTETLPPDSVLDLADAFAYASERYALAAGIFGCDANICDCDGFWHRTGCTDCQNATPEQRAQWINYSRAEDGRTTMCNHCGQLYNHVTREGHVAGCPMINAHRIELTS